MEQFLQIERYMIRLTNDVDISEIETLISPLTTGVYIIGSELSCKGKRHFHIYLETQNDEKTLRESINKAGYKGIQGYNIKKADNNSKIKRYVVKDGEFVYKGIDEKLINQWVKMSHSKIKDGYADERTALEDKFICDPRNTYMQFGTQILQLENKYGIKPLRNRHVSYINYMRIKKNPEYASELNALFLRE